jgi:hypothetical protein
MRGQARWFGDHNLRHIKISRGGFVFYNAGAIFCDFDSSD